MRVSQFQRTSPSRLFNKASTYTKNLGHFHELPKNISKSMVVRNQAEYQKDDIQYVIKQSKYQLELYRKKQNQDMMRRTHFEKKIISAADKVVKNEKDIDVKKTKDAVVYEKHLKDVYKKFQADEKRHRQSEKQQSYKLRNELQQFYDKQAERKKNAQFKQVSVGTCYQSAVAKIDNIHKKNQQYSLRAEQQLNKELDKNNHLDQIIQKKKRSVSYINQQKSKIYDDSLSILQNRQKNFIQKYGRNEDGSINAFKHIEQQDEKQKKRLHQFFKKRVEKWSQQKKRVDAAKAQISQKCTSILERTNNSFFRQTVSSFRSTSKEWLKIVQKNKSSIKNDDQMKKDDIMENHLDLRLRNTSSFKVSQKMYSMRLQARKLASIFL